MTLLGNEFHSEKDFCLYVAPRLVHTVQKVCIAERAQVLAVGVLENAVQVIVLVFIPRAMAAVWDW